MPVLPAYGIIAIVSLHPWAALSFPQVADHQSASAAEKEPADVSASQERFQLPRKKWNNALDKTFQHVLRKGDDNRSLETLIKNNNNNVATSSYFRGDIIRHVERSSFQLGLQDTFLNVSSLRSQKRKQPPGPTLGDNYYEVDTHVMIDSVLYTAISSSIVKDVLTYLKIFFRSVNNIYDKGHSSDSTFPKIVFQVALLTVLERSDESTIFQPIPPDETENGDDGVFDIEDVLKRVKMYGERGNEKFDKYDHTVLLTGRDLYRKVENSYQPDVLGVAFLSGACTKSTDEKYESFSVVEDVGGHFLGVYAAVHEFAHNLGVRHDSKKKFCPPKKGHIMSPNTERTENMFQFSNCSLSALNKFLKSRQGKCLAKTSGKPVFPANPADKFPGDVYNMLDICDYYARIHYNEVLDVTVNMAKSPTYLCRQLSCRITTTSGQRLTYEPPFAPGELVDCGKHGEGGRCVSGECVGGR